MKLRIEVLQRQRHGGGRERLLVRYIWTWYPWRKTGRGDKGLTVS